MAIRRSYGPDMQLLGALAYGAGQNQGEFQSAQQLANVYTALQSLDINRQQLALQQESNQRADQQHLFNLAGQLPQLLSYAAPLVGYGLGGAPGYYFGQQLFGQQRSQDRMVPAPSYIDLFQSSSGSRY